MIPDSSTSSRRHSNFGLKYRVGVKRWCALLFVTLFLVGFYPTSAESYTCVKGEQDSLNTPLYHYTEAIKAYHIHRDSERAKALLQSSLVLDSLYAPANYKLAELLLQDGDKQALLEHAELAYRADTLNKFYLQLYAHSLVVSMRFQQALEFYYKLLEIDRHNPENYRVTALLEDQVGNKDGAIAVLDSAEVLFGVDGRLGSLKRTLLIQQKHFDRALEEAKRAVDATPYDPYNHLSLGEIYVALGNDSLAKHSFNRAVELDSANLETLIKVGDYYFRTGDINSYLSVIKLVFEHPDMPLESKLYMYNRFVGDTRFYREHYPQISSLAMVLALSYPNEKEVVELYANNLLAWGEVEKALHHYKQHLSDTPPVKDYFISTIQIEDYLHRPDSVDKYLSQAISLFPEDHELHIHKGLIAFSKRDLDGCLKSYREALELVETDSLRSVMWGLIGDLYQATSQGDISSTEKSFKLRSNGKGGWKKYMKRCYDAYDKALKYDRDNIAVLNNYAYFLSLEERDLNRALEYSSRCIALTENNPTYLDTHAWVLFKLGRLNEAKHYLQQAVSLDGQKSPELQLHYGDVLAALGEKFMAETYWKRARDNGYDKEAIEQRLNNLKSQPQTK